MKPDLIDQKTAGTLVGLFEERVRRSPHATAYREFDAGAKAWRDYSWADMAVRVAQVRKAIAGVSLAPGDRIAVILPNGTDWVRFDLAGLGLGLVIVPLYSHDSPANNAHVLSDSGARLLLVDSATRWEEIWKHRASFPALEEVWIRAGIGDMTLAEQPEIRIREFADVLPSDSKGTPSHAAKPDDLATLIYTSGTTGPPKGVMLTHAALLWNAEAITGFVPPLPNDIFLSFLPLAHAFERTLGYYLPIIGGSTVAYARSIETLREDLATVRPTILVSVPRIYERIYAAIRTQTETSRIRQALLEWTTNIGWEFFQARQRLGPRPTLVRRLIWPLLYRLIARKILDAFGGRLRVAICGGAALPREVARFFLGMQLPLLEGYGLTEAAPIVTASSFKESSPGSVGKALEGSELRLSERSELQVRTPSIMLGYWNNPEATAAVLDDKGWLGTGDIAEIRDEWVFFKGRLKDILVLATGENVNPGPVEAALVKDDLFDQACVIGDGKPYLAAFLVLNEARWQGFAAKRDLPADDLESEAARSAILGHLQTLLTDQPRTAQVRAVHLEQKLWTVKDCLLTPTLKVKRRAIEEHYAWAIKRLYEGHAIFA